MRQYIPEEIQESTAKNLALYLNDREKFDSLSFKKVELEYATWVALIILTEGDFEHMKTVYRILGVDFPELPTVEYFLELQGITYKKPCPSPTDTQSPEEKI